MFGTIICNKKGLTKKELARYQGVYCGLCKAIKGRYGQLGRLSLNYDMAFLALLLNGLYEESNAEQWIRCPVHPLKEREVFQNKYIDYAADMTILLAYYKCKDDWEDERKKSGKLYGMLLQKCYEQVARQYPRQTRCVKESLEELGQIEKSAVSLPDEAVNCSGRMLSEIFVYEEDFWSASLREFGYELGRFIYLMDAVLDYERDRKKHTYNPLFSMGRSPEELEPILMQAIGNATFQFEQMPIVQDANIMRNILYGGIWQRYHAKEKGKEKHSGLGSRQQPLQKPARQPGDSEQIRQAVDFIYMESCDYASQVLNRIVSGKRNARWHYLNALANYGLGNQIRALEEMQMALQLEPDSQVYWQAYGSMRQTGVAYTAKRTWLEENCKIEKMEEKTRKNEI